MAAKDVKNLIITLVILAIGIYVIALFTRGFAAGTTLQGVAELVAAMQGLSNLIILGIVVLVIILIPVYLSKRSKEKKGAAPK